MRPPSPNPFFLGSSVFAAVSSAGFADPPARPEAPAATVAISVCAFGV